MVPPTKVVNIPYGVVVGGTMHEGTLIRGGFL